jgi:hypothetical protein
MSVTVDKRGPLFDGRAEKEVADACEEIEKSVSTLGASMVRSRLNSGVLKKQTPYYRMRVVNRPEAPGWKITDQGVIYGYWLEGIGSRNAPVTRFKGYHTFRIITSELNGRCVAIANGVLAKFAARMNG